TTVTIADVERVAKAYFKPQNRALGRFIPTDKPDRADMPARPDLSVLLADYKGDASLSEGEVFDTAPANIVKRSERYALANGLKVVLLPKKTRGATVQLALRIGYGDEKSRAGKSAVDALANATLMRGADGLTRQQIYDKLDALRTSGGVGLSGGAMQTKKAYLNDAISLIAQVYRTATFPSEELELVRKEMITAIEESAKDPERVAFNALERHSSPYPKGDPRYIATVAERVADLRAVTREQVVNYARQMRGLSAGTLAIVGDFDAASVKPVLATSFGQSKLATPFARINREHKTVAVKNDKLPTPDKENATFVARVTFPLQDSAADYPALLLADFIVGGSGGARLFMRVREKEGLSYDVFSNLAIPTFGTNGSWTFGFIANPQNAAKAEASLKDELQKLLNGELTEKEFTEQQQSLLDQRAVRRAQDATLAAQIVSLTDANRSFEYVETLEARLSKLTKADFDAVLKKYIKLAEMSSFVAGDFSKVK
nr:insulinase family protein [Burkholderiales bacterium]